MSNGRKRIMAFVDGANHHKAAKMLNINIDWLRILDFLDKRGELVRAHYLTMLSGQGDSKSYETVRRLLDWLSFNGYTTHEKEYRDFTTEEGIVRHRGTIDVDMTTLLLTEGTTVDEVYIFSGNGEYKAPIEELKRRGIKVILVSTISGPTKFVSNSLRKSVDAFIDLRDLEEEVSRSSDGYVADIDDVDPLDED